jgi:hypothetical protein
MAEETKTPKTDDQMVTEQYSNWNTVRTAFLIAGILALVVYFQDRKK